MSRCHLFLEDRFLVDAWLLAKMSNFVTRGSSAAACTRLRPGMRDTILLERDAFHSACFLATRLAAICLIVGPSNGTRISRCTSVCVWILLMISITTSVPPIFKALPSCANGRSCTRREMIALLAPCCAQSQIIEYAPGQVVPGGCSCARQASRGSSGWRPACRANALGGCSSSPRRNHTGSPFFEVRGADVRSRGDRHRGIEGGLNMFSLRGVLVPAAIRTGVCSPMRASRHTRQARCCTSQCSARCPCISAPRRCRKPPSPFWP